MTAGGVILGVVSFVAVSVWIRQRARRPAVKPIRTTSKFSQPALIVYRLLQDNGASDNKDRIEAVVRGIGEEGFIRLAAKIVDANVDKTENLISGIVFGLFKQSVEGAQTLLARLSQILDQAIESREHSFKTGERLQSEIAEFRGSSSATQSMLGLPIAFIADGFAEGDVIPFGLIMIFVIAPLMVRAAKASSKADAIAEAEASRIEWEEDAQSYLLGLFNGRSNTKLIFPYPEQTAEDRRIGDELLARVEEHLKKHINPRDIERDSKIPLEEIKPGLIELGLFAMKTPKEHGGLGLSQTNYMRVLQLVDSWSHVLAVLLSGHQSIGLPQPLKLTLAMAEDKIKRAKTEEARQRADHLRQVALDQQSKYYPLLAQGNISAFAITEVLAGSDPSNVQTTAEWNNDEQKWVINGEKLWITNSWVARYVVVLARLVEDGKPTRKTSLFIVDTQAKGFALLERLDFMGLRGIENATFRLKNVKVGEDDLLGDHGEGLKIALATLNTGRLSLAAMVLGTLKRAYGYVADHANGRVQFGLPIGRHDANAQKLAEIAKTIDILEAISWYPALLVDQVKGADIRLESALAKLVSTEFGWHRMDDIMQIYGGAGYEAAASKIRRGAKGDPIEQMFRDFRINTIFEGSTEIQNFLQTREALAAHINLLEPILNPTLNPLKNPKAVWPDTLPGLARLGIRGLGEVIILILSLIIPGLWARRAQAKRKQIDALLSGLNDVRKQLERERENQDLNQKKNTLEAKIGRISPVLNPGYNLRKIDAPVDFNAQAKILRGQIGKIIKFYAVWYPWQWNPFRWLFIRDARLRYIQRTSQRLAIRLFHHMMVFGPALEQQQRIMFGFVSAADSLYNVAVMTSRERMMTAKGVYMGEIAQLYFEDVKRDIKGRDWIPSIITTIRKRRAQRNHAIGLEVLAGRHSRFTEGIITDELPRQSMIRVDPSGVATIILSFEDQRRMLTIEMYRALTQQIRGQLYGTNGKPVVTAVIVEGNANGTSIEQHLPERAREMLETESEFYREINKLPVPKEIGRASCRERV
jgi:hypothetical protein